MKLREPILLLIAANLLPVYGVLVWDWDVFAVMFLFWCENVVIGIFGLAKTSIFLWKSSALQALFLTAFFTVHYGGFMYGHLMILTSLFGDGTDTREQLEAMLGLATWVTIVALFISHGWSFVENYLGKREYESLTNMGAMAMPYKRMMITHVALIVGGLLLSKFDEPLLGLLLLLGMKIALDITFHKREHEMGTLE